MNLPRCSSFVFLSLLLIAAVGCEPDSRELEEPAQSPVSAPTLFDIPHTHTSYSQAGGIEDFSYGGVKRVSMRIVVPLGRTREELRVTLDRAARKLAKETQANAVLVFAYRPQDDPSGEYSAGRAVYAPNGEWGDAASSAPMRVSVDLNNLYFAPPTNKIAIGEFVSLQASSGGVIEVSKEYGSLMEEDIIARVPNGTEATVVERRSEPLGDREFVRYRVRFTHRGREITGWVSRSNVESE